MRDAGLTLDSSYSKCIGGEFHEHLTGEGAVTYVKISNVGDELVGVIAAGESDEMPAQRLDAVVISGLSMPRRYANVS